MKTKELIKTEIENRIIAILQDVANDDLDSCIALTISVILNEITDLRFELQKLKEGN